MKMTKIHELWNVYLSDAINKKKFMTCGGRISSVYGYVEGLHAPLHFAGVCGCGDEIN